MNPPNTTPLNEELTKILLQNGYSDIRHFDECVEELTNLIQTLEKKARIELFNLYGTPVCENLHHPKKYQHKYFENCPVVERIAQLEKGTE